MAIVITRPITEEQLREAEQKKIAQADVERKLDQDLINAYMLQKIAALEALNDDNN